MPRERIIPTADEIIGPGIDELVRLRPSALRHVNLGTGRWSHLFEGWRGQVNLLLRRLGDEVRSKRLPLAAGEALAALVRSEHWTDVNEDGATAVGEVILSRSTGPLLPGVIRRGHRWRKEGKPDAHPVAKAEAIYTATRDVRVSLGQTSVTVPIEAVRPGVHGNIVRGLEDPDVETAQGPIAMTDIKSAQPLFDSRFTTADCFAAGGADTGFDPVAVQPAARAIYSAQYGPVADALIGGALETPGVARVAVIDDVPTASSIVLVADASWGTSGAFSQRVLRRLLDKPYIGFGCAASVTGIVNYFVHLDLTVKLTDGRFLNDTDELSEAIGKVVAAYFNDRPNFWIWRKADIRGVVSRASRKIQACTEAVVKSALTGAEQSEPDPAKVAFTGIYTHLYLPTNAITIDFVAP